MSADSGATRRTILVIGTCDTKSDELRLVRDCLAAAGGAALLMDVGVLGAPSFAPDVSNREVAAAAGSTLEEIAASGDENQAMIAMASGAAQIARRLHADDRVHGLIVLGGTMGTDLGLDVAAALPLGVPKVVVSTVAFSHLIPPERIAPDLMMILWAGGLYGLNAVCQEVLEQAAGAVLGASRAQPKAATARPLIGMTSLGKSCLRYMVELKPALDARGFEVAVFHTTGMGGRAFEALAAQGRFAAVLDLSLQEISNYVNGSVVHSGASRLEAAGRAGVPQIVAPGAIDMIDVPAWQTLPERYRGRPYHQHNRLIGSVLATADERRASARHIAEKLASASAATVVVLPLQGIQEWDRPGQPLRDLPGHQAFVEEMRHCVRAPARLVEIDAHINDPAFAATVLGIFDDWVAHGVVPKGATAL